MDKDIENLLKKHLESDLDQNNIKKQELIFDRIVLEGLRRNLSNINPSSSKESQDKEEFGE